MLSEWTKELCFLITALYCAKEHLSPSTSSHIVTHGHVAEWTCWLLKEKNSSQVVVCGRSSYTSTSMNSAGQVQHTPSVWLRVKTNALSCHIAQTAMTRRKSKLCENWSNSSQGWVGVWLWQISFVHFYEYYQLGVERHTSVSCHSLKDA